MRGGILFSICFILISCSSSDKMEQKEKEVEDRNLSTLNLQFETKQDSLRNLLLNLKPNQYLKSSILKELYIKGLIDQVGDKIKFHLPFDLHSFDCGAPDCYSTDITFEIQAKEVVKFPLKLSFHIFEHGCLDNEISINAEFQLMEQTPQYLNYYSKKMKSNLVFVWNKNQLFYFEETELYSINKDIIEHVFEENEEGTNTNVPFQSTMMNEF